MDTATTPLRRTEQNERVNKLVSLIAHICMTIAIQTGVKSRKLGHVNT